MARAHANQLSLLSFNTDPSGRLSQTPKLLSRKGGDFVLFKAGREEAYKQLPTDPSDQRNAIVALRRPATTLWRGFVTLTMIFGSIAALLHYNVMSLILVALTNRAMGIPIVGYFDDFEAMIREQLVGALRVFTEFFRLSGFHLNPAKSSV